MYVCVYDCVCDCIKCNTFYVYTEIYISPIRYNCKDI